MKRLILIVMLLAALLGFTQIAGNAETVPQLRLRLFQEAQQKHPDIWNGCTATCLDARVKAEPWLTGLAIQANVPITDLVKYDVVRGFDWGLNFENTKAANTDCRAKSTKDVNLCAPTIYDWQYSYIDNGEQIRAELAASPVLTAVNTWTENRYFRLKREYGGPF